MPSHRTSRPASLFFALFVLGVLPACIPGIRGLKRSAGLRRPNPGAHPSGGPITDVSEGAGGELGPAGLTDPSAGDANGYDGAHSGNSGSQGGAPADGPRGNARQNGQRPPGAGTGGSTAGAGAPNGEKPGTHEQGTPPEAASTDEKPLDEELGTILPLLLEATPEFVHGGKKLSLDDLRALLKEKKVTPFAIAQEITEAYANANRGKPRPDDEGFFLGVGAPAGRRTLPKLLDQEGKTLTVERALEKIPFETQKTGEKKDRTVRALIHDLVKLGNGLRAAVEVKGAHQNDEQKMKQHSREMLETLVVAMAAVRAMPEGAPRNKLVGLLGDYGLVVSYVLKREMTAGLMDEGLAKYISTLNHAPAEWKGFIREQFRGVRWAEVIFGVENPEVADAGTGPRRAGGAAGGRGEQARRHDASTGRARGTSREAAGH